MYEAIAAAVIQAAVNGMSAGLSGSRPTIVWGQVHCMKCDAPCEFDQTGGHRLMAGDDSGYIYLRAYCHGEHEDITITFDAARRNRNARIEVFVEDTTRALPVEQTLTIEDSSSI